MKVQPGTTLQRGKYLLDQPLGHGGVGATFLATQTFLNHPIVIKTLDPSWQVTQSFSHLKARFIEDMRLLACSQHSSIVRVFDFFQEEGLPFLVMEYVPGQTFHDRIASVGTFSEVEAIHYIRQIGSALSVAHRHGLIHHNISPSAIVRRQGTNLAILVGFGLGHDVAAVQPTPANAFAPPESNWGKGNRFAIDLYALSATFYYLLSGEMPTGDLVLDQKPWLTTTKQAILRGLSQDPQQQLQTIDDWLKLLPNTSLPLMTANTPEAEPQQNAAQPQAPAASNHGANSTANGATLNGAIANGATANGTEKLNPSNNGNNGAAKSKSPVLPGISSAAANGTVPTKLTPSPTAQPSQTVVPASIGTTVQTKKTPAKQPAIARSMGAERHFPKFLLLTIAAATAMGAGFGFALRISATKAPGTSILHPAQVFEDKEWKGTLNVKDGLSDVPIENTTGSFRNQLPNTPRSPKTNLVPAPIPSVSPQIPQLDLPEWERPIIPNPVSPRSNRSQSVAPPVPLDPVSPAIEPPLPPAADKPIAPPAADSSTAPVPPVVPNERNNQEAAPTLPNRPES